MNKKEIAGIVVVLVSLLFITEQFYLGGSQPGVSGPTNPGSNVSGTAVFNGTIRTYDPYVIIALNTSADTLAQLKKRSDVRDVKNSSQGLIVDIDTRDDVFPVGQYLQSMNVTSYAIANVVATDVIQVTTPIGIVNASLPNGVVRVVTEPLVDADNVVTVSMVATVSDGQVIDVQSASVLLQDVELQLDANVQSLDHETYSYVIPWEDRTSLTNLSQYGSYDFNKVDSIVFNTPLTVSQVLVKKQFPYIVYIDPNSAQVDPSFANLSLVSLNFQDTQYTLPPSTLTIMTNTTPNIPFNSTVSYSYELVINQSETPYKFPTGSFFIESNTQLPVNGTLKLNISAVGLGDKILTVRRVSLPS